jgi:hypothetical protein
MVRSSPDQLNTGSVNFVAHSMFPKGRHNNGVWCIELLVEGVTYTTKILGRGNSVIRVWYLDLRDDAFCGFAIRDAGEIFDAALL